MNKNANKKNCLYITYIRQFLKNKNIIYLTGKLGTTYIILKKKIKVNLADNYETELYEEITTSNDDQNS